MQEKQIKTNKIIIDILQKYIKDERKFTKNKKVLTILKDFTSLPELQELKELNKLEKGFSDMSVLECKRHLSRLQCYYSARKIRKDIKEMLITMSQKSITNVDFFNERVKLLNTYLNNLILFTLMHDNFTVITQEDREHKVRLLNYCITYAAALNEELEHWVDVFPSKIKQIYLYSKDVVLLIHLLKKIKAETKKQILSINKNKYY